MEYIQPNPGEVRLIVFSNLEANLFNVQYVTLSRTNKLFIHYNDGTKIGAKITKQEFEGLERLSDCIRFVEYHSGKVTA